MRQEPFERPSRLDGPHHAAARYPANIVRKRAQKAVRPVNMLCPAKPRHSCVGERRRSRTKQLSEASQPLWRYRRLSFASSGNTKIKRPTRPHVHQYPLFAQISAFLVRPDGWLAPILSNSFLLHAQSRLNDFVPHAVAAGSDRFIVASTTYGTRRMEARPTYLPTSR